MPQSRCYGCGIVQFKKHFPAHQWNKKRDRNLRRYCCLCVEEKKTAGTPWECVECGYWKVPDCFEPGQLTHNSTNTRVCKDCIEVRVCGRCGENKTEEEFTKDEWRRASRDPLGQKSIRQGKCRACRHKGFLQCKGPCGRRLEPSRFHRFLATPTSKTNKGNAYCDECFKMPKLGAWTCKHCGAEKDKEIAFSQFRKTPSALTHSGDACCDSCWAVTKMPTWMCKRCGGQKNKKDAFSEFRKTQSARTHIGDACCDACWAETKMPTWTCKHCGDRKAKHSSFNEFRKTPSALANIGDACCDSCWAVTKMPTWMCKRCGDRKDKENAFSEFHKSRSARTHIGDACCDACWGNVKVSRWTCKKCGEMKDREIEFSEFRKKKSSATNIGNAICDSCVNGPQLWKCVECKRDKPKDDFSTWLKPRPSRHQQRQCKVARCNGCTEQGDRERRQMSSRDAREVIKKESPSSKREHEAARLAAVGEKMLSRSAMAAISIAGASKDSKPPRVEKQPKSASKSRKADRLESSTAAVHSSICGQVGTTLETHPRQDRSHRSGPNAEVRETSSDACGTAGLLGIGIRGARGSEREQPKEVVLNPSIIQRLCIQCKKGKIQKCFSETSWENQSKRVCTDCRFNIHKSATRL